MITENQKKKKTICKINTLFAALRIENQAVMVSNTEKETKKKKKKKHTREKPDLDVHELGVE